MSTVRPINEAELLSMKVGGVLLTYVAGIFLLQFPSYYRSELAFEANAISVTGTVIKTREERQYYGGGGIVPLSYNTKYISTVKFQTLRGERLVFTTSNACSTKKGCKDKTVQVLYDPSEPTEPRIYSATTLRFRLWSYIIFWLIIFLIGILLFVFVPGNHSNQIND